MSFPAYVGANCTAVAAGERMIITRTGAAPSFTTPSDPMPGAHTFGIRVALAKTAGAAPGAAWVGRVRYSTTGGGGHAVGAGYEKSIPAPVGYALDDEIWLEWNMSALDAGGTDWLASEIDQVRFELDDDPGSVWSIRELNFGWASFSPVIGDPQMETGGIMTRAVDANAITNRGETTFGALLGKNRGGGSTTSFVLSPTGGNIYDNTATVNGNGMYLLGGIAFDTTDLDTTATGNSVRIDFNCVYIANGGVGSSATGYDFYFVLDPVEDPTWAYASPGAVGSSAVTNHVSGCPTWGYTGPGAYLKAYQTLTTPQANSFVPISLYALAADLAPGTHKVWIYYYQTAAGGNAGIENPTLSFGRNAR